MNKRGYIDTARQYARLASRKKKSYSDSVKALYEMYMKSVEESGASEAELTKEQDWAQAFLLREYFPSDQTADTSWLG